MIKVLIAIGILSLAACEKQGPMEEAGEKLDDAVENIRGDSRDAMDTAADKIENSVEDVADEIEDNQ